MYVHYAAEIKTQAISDYYQSQIFYVESSSITALHHLHRHIHYLQKQVDTIWSSVNDIS